MSTTNNQDFVQQSIEQSNEEHQNECSICLADHNNQLVLSCGHIFHIDCMKNWVFKNIKILRPSNIESDFIRCPNCRNIFTDKDLKSIDVMQIVTRSYFMVSPQSNQIIDKVVECMQLSVEPLIEAVRNCKCTCCNDANADTADATNSTDTGDVVDADVDADAATDAGDAVDGSGSEDDNND